MTGRDCFGFGEKKGKEGRRCDRRGVTERGCAQEVGCRGAKDDRRRESDASVQQELLNNPRKLPLDYIDTRAQIYISNSNVHTRVFLCLPLGAGSDCRACKQELSCFQQTGSPAGAYTRHQKKKKLDSPVIVFICFAGFVETQIAGPDSLFIIQRSVRGFHYRYCLQKEITSWRALSAALHFRFCLLFFYLPKASTKGKTGQ